MSYARLINETKPRARKPHFCEAFQLIQYDISQGSEIEQKFTPEEMAAVEAAKEQNGRIQKGEIYLCQTCEFDGFIYRFKAKPELWEICKKYEIGFDEY
jgi:hypothetical protein